MKVAIMIGKNGPEVINKCRSSLDNIDFSCFSSIDELIEESLSRRKFFDRIVFSRVVVKNDPDALEKLNSYIVLHSDNTTVVYISRGSIEEADAFSKVFNSPMYTPVLVTGLSVPTFIDIVKGDIVEVKTKYYSLDVADVKKSVSRKESHNNDSPKRKGLFSSFGKGKENVEPENASASSSNMGESVGDFRESGLSGDVTDSAMEGSSSSRYLGEDGGSPNYDREDIGSSYDNYSGSPGSPVVGSDFDDDDDLSLADFGGMHVDTGYLDESVVPLDNLEGLEQSLNDKVEEPVESGVFHKRSNYQEDLPERVARVKSGASPKIGIAVFSRDCLDCLALVDNVTSLSEKGYRVLLMDLDYKGNSLLGYLDTEKFYFSGGFNGIEKRRVYKEDGVDFLSNGFGCPVTSSQVKSLSDSGFLNSYEYVFINCPVDCLDCLDSSLILNSKVKFSVSGSRQSLAFLFEMLSGLGYSVEKSLFDCASFELIHEDRVDKEYYFKKDVQFFNSVCYFPRYDWVSKVCC